MSSGWLYIGKTEARVLRIAIVNLMDKDSKKAPEKQNLKAQMTMVKVYRKLKACN